MAHTSGAVAPSTDTSCAAPAVVRGHEITKRFGEGAAAVDALRGVSVDFERGSFTAIMGPSGSGKSRAFRTGSRL